MSVLVGPVASGCVYVDDERARLRLDDPASTRVDLLRGDTARTSGSRVSSNGVFVVSGSGVLGRRLLPLLTESGVVVRALARSRRSAEIIAAHGGEAFAGDLLEIDAVRLAKFVEGCASVVHIATSIPRSMRAGEAWESNTRLRVDGTQTLIRAASYAGVRRYVQSSVSMVYADGADHWLDENAPFDDSPSRKHIVDPVVEMERIVRSMPSSIGWTILRGGQFVGPGSFEDGTRRALRSGTFEMREDGTRFFSPVSADEMAHAVALALARTPDGSIFNVNREPLRWGEYIDDLARQEKVAPPTRGSMKSPQPSQRCDARRIERVTGWSTAR